MAHGTRLTAHGLRLATVAIVLTIAMARPDAQVRLADESDRAAFRSWFVLLADAQFERATPDVTDCAALVRHAFREALRAHTPEWVRRANLPFAPQFADVGSAPQPPPSGWARFCVAARAPPPGAGFGDAETRVGRHPPPLGRNAAAARAGDLLYFHQPGQAAPDHLMVVVGRSFFEADGADWVVYHTGPTDDGPGEVRKAQLGTLARHPSPRWRPVPANPNFVGVFRLVVL